MSSQLTAVESPWLVECGCSILYINNFASEHINTQLNFFHPIQTHLMLCRIRSSDNLQSRCVNPQVFYTFFSSFNYTLFCFNSKLRTSINVWIRADVGFFIRFCGLQKNSIVVAKTASVKLYVYAISIASWDELQK